jgi:DNA-binding GntR family transcriptional regulator
MTEESSAVSYGNPNRSQSRNRVAPLGQSKQTLLAQVVERLRDDITSGYLAPGVRLQAETLAQELGVSRMPVREALHILQAEGLVELFPYRGAIVSQLTRTEIIEVFTIRIILEPQAVKLGVERMTNDDLQQLRQFREELESSERDVNRWIELDRAFFTFLFELSGHPRLCELISQQRASIERYVRAYISVPINIPRARLKHLQIYEACEHNDRELAMQRTREHLEEVRDIFLGQLELTGEEAASS